METRFGSFDRAARSRHRLRRRDEVAVAVGGPNGILAGSILPGHLIAGCRLLGADRRPAATKLTRNNVRAAIFERGA